MRNTIPNRVAGGCSIAMFFWASAAFAVPLYVQTAIIPVIPVAGNAAGAFSFDISQFDGSTQLDYVTDRPNASVDIFSAATNSFVGRITGSGANAFVGTVPSPDTGPDGVLILNTSTQHIVYAGDGNSTVKAFDLNNGNLPATGSPIATGAASQGRADEVAVNPTGHVLLVANDHGTPAPFVSLIDTTTNTVVKKIVFDGTSGTPNATNGIEQPVWNATTGRFYISVPRIGAAPDPGGIAEIDPVSGTVTKVYDLSTFGISACNPTGLALGVGNQMMIGCSTTQSILFDPTANGGNGSVVATFSQATGVDELTYDPSLHLFFLASSANGVSVIDGLTDTFIQQLITFAGSHSVAVDPVSNELFVPLRNNLSIAGCATGCVEVFAVAVPEPGTLPLMAGGLFAITALTWRRKRHAPWRQAKG